MWDRRRHRTQLVFAGLFGADRAFGARRADGVCVSQVVDTSSEPTGVRRPDGSVWVTRATVEALTGLSRRTVTRHEAAWGLQGVREMLPDSNAWMYPVSKIVGLGECTQERVDRLVVAGSPRSRDAREVAAANALLEKDNAVLAAELRGEQARTEAALAQVADHALEIARLRAENKQLLDIVYSQAVAHRNSA